MPRNGLRCVCNSSAADFLAMGVQFHGAGKAAAAIIAAVAATAESVRVKHLRVKHFWKCQASQGWECECDIVRVW